MTAFEFIFALMTIITSLAVTHMLTGLVRVLQNVERVRFSLVHGLWAWSAMLLAIGNWASMWGMRAVDVWPAWTVLLCVTVMISLYVFCGLVTPELQGSGSLDLDEFHRRRSLRYASAAVVFFGLAIAANTSLGGAGFYASWVRDNWVSVAGLVLSLVACLATNGGVQVIVASALAMLTTYYAVVTCNVVAS
jgi:hypothetical protein